MTTEKSFDLNISDLHLTGFGNHSYQREETPISLTGEGNRISDRSNTNNTDNAWGINHRQVPLALQQTKDGYGLTFVTRPQLNLTDRNCRQDRLFARLLTSNDKSIQRMVRCLLDPRLQYNVEANSEGGMESEKGDPQSYIECPLVDMHQAFIPFFTNNLISLSGFPDLNSTTYSAKEGPYKEAYSFVDGPTINYTEYDVVANLRNIQGDPISALAFFWIHYSSIIFEGTKLYAYGDFIANREIDYQTRIYRFLLDPSKRFIQRMACSGASYPYALTMGSYYDFDSTKPYNEASQNIQIPFKCMGAIYEDDLIIRSFNDVVSYFHPEMKEDQEAIISKPTSAMTKIPVDNLFIFNHRGYPWINPETYEIEWYVSTEYYESKLASYTGFARSLVSSMGINL